MSRNGAGEAGQSGPGNLEEDDRPERRREAQSEPESLNWPTTNGFRSIDDAFSRDDAVRSFSERDFATALVLIDKADAIHSPTPMSLNVRGAVAIEERRFEEGRTLCLNAMKLDPHFFPARFNLGEIPFVQGKYAEAR